MLSHKKEKVLIFISIMIIIFNFIGFLKRKVSFYSKVDTEIAKGIVVFEHDETIEKKVNRDSFPLEYNFLIKNFDDKGNINEVDFNYRIKLVSSVDNFPIKYRLIDCESNNDIYLNSGESQIPTLDKYNKKIRKFKLYVEWNDVEIKYSNDLEMKIKVEAVQEEENVESEKS